MLLHIVCTGKLFVAARERALNGLLGCVDFGVAGRMARCSEGLFTAMALAVPAGVSLTRFFLGGVGTVVLI